jgi:hypothetical protein
VNEEAIARTGIQSQREREKTVNIMTVLAFQISSAEVSNEDPTRG